MSDMTGPVETTMSDSPPSEGPAGLRERKKAKTRDDIREAATELFATQGFDNTTIEEIAARCDVSPRTFFRYFASKEELLFVEGEERCQELLAELAARPASETPLVALRASFLQLASVLESDREGLMKRKRIYAETPSLRTRHLERQQSWDQEIFEALRDRPGASKQAVMDLRLVAGASMAALHAAADTWLEEGGDLRVLVERAFDRISTGLT
jgi:AcrR family transcriptional regulator